MSNQKNGGGCLPLIGTVIIIFIGGGYLFNRFFLGKELTPLEGAKLIPEEALITSYISTEPQAWSKLDNVGIPKQIIQDSIDSLEEELVTNSTINYQEDIQPWLGGVMVAVLPETTTPQDNVLVILGIKNKLKARSFFKKLEKEEQQTSQEIQYKGITITETTESGKQQIYSTVLDNKLLLAFTRQPLEQAIDTYKGEPSLLSQPEAKQALSQPLKLQNSLGQVYFTNYSQLVKRLTNTQKISPALLAQLEQINSVVLGVSSETKGLHFQAVTQVNPESLLILCYLR
jgi:hypothetical protein